MAQESIIKRVFFSIYSYTIIYAFFGVLSLSYHACFNSSLSTLEKRYRFPSSTGGLIMIADNIATVLTNLFIGYYGKTAHKPRWMSIGCVVTGLSVMITALPYFIYGPVKEVELELVANLTLSRSKSSLFQGDQMCMLEQQVEDCSEINASGMMTKVAVTCFAVSNFFRGFGTSIYFTYGTPYLDDNVSKAKMPTFFAFTFAARILGAPIGFYLQSLALKYYENPFSIPAGITHNDPRWIGAWWIGFLVSGSLMLLLAIPLALFPREFKKKKEKRNTEAAAAATNTTALALPATAASDGEFVQLVESSVAVSNDSSSTALNGNNKNNSTILTDQQIPTIKSISETISNGKQPAVVAGKKGYYKINKQADDDDDDEDYYYNQKENKKKDENLSLLELPGEIYAIISNPIIVCQMMGNLFRGIGILGYFVFQTKYLEAQFRQSASKASLVSGTTGFLAKIFGVLFGGLLISMCRPGPRTLTTYIFIVELTSVFTLLYGASVIGPQYMYPSTSLMENNQLNLKNTCNTACNCEHVRYQPVCEHLEMKAYFSPCHAGCKMSYKTADNSSAVYSECSCADSSTKTLEKCPPDSERLIQYATIVALGGMISGSSRSGNMVTFFRSINPDQKSLAVAVGSFWHSLFVSIPYPIIYAKIFDSSCLIWSEECGKQGNCWLYDTEKLRKRYHYVSIALIALGSVFDFIMIFLSPRLGNLYDDEGKKTFRDKIISLFTRCSKKKTIDKKGGEEGVVDDLRIREAATVSASNQVLVPPQQQQQPQQLQVTKL